MALQPFREAVALLAPRGNDRSASGTVDLRAERVEKVETVRESYARLQVVVVVVVVVVADIQSSIFQTF